MARLVLVSLALGLFVCIHAAPGYGGGRDDSEMAMAMLSSLKDTHCGGAFSADHGLIDGLGGGHGGGLGRGNEGDLDGSLEGGLSSGKGDGHGDGFNDGFGSNGGGHGWNGRAVFRLRLSANALASASANSGGGRHYAGYGR